MSARIVLRIAGAAPSPPGPRTLSPPAGDQAGAAFHKFVEEEPPRARSKSGDTDFAARKTHVDSQPAQPTQPPLDALWLLAGAKTQTTPEPQARQKQSGSASDDPHVAPLRKTPAPNAARDTGESEEAEPPPTVAPAQAGAGAAAHELSRSETPDTTVEAAPAISMTTHVDTLPSIARQIASSIAPAIDEAHGAPPAPSSPAPVAEQVQRSSVRSIVVELAPKELGAVRVRLTMTSQNVRLRIEVDNPAALSTIHAARDELATILARPGVGAADISIAQGGGPNETSALPAQDEAPVNGRASGDGGGQGAGHGQDFRNRSEDQNDRNATRSAPAPHSGSGGGGLVL